MRSSGIHHGIDFWLKPVLPPLLRARLCTSFRSVSFNGTNTGISWIRGVVRVIAITPYRLLSRTLISRTRRADGSREFRPQQLSHIWRETHFLFLHVVTEKPLKRVNCNRYSVRICVVFLVCWAISQISISLKYQLAIPCTFLQIQFYWNKCMMYFHNNINNVIVN